MSAPSLAPRPECVWALVPVKRFEAAKSRLTPVLGDVERHDLARGFCEHVLSVLARSPGIAGIMVATDGRDVAELARSRGAVVVPDTTVGRLGPVIDAALPHLAARGATAALVLMSDLPRLEAAEVEALTAALEGHDLVLAPDERDEGTNALVLRLPATQPTRFGHADSFRRHLAAAAERHARCVVHRSAGLAFDVDDALSLSRVRSAG